MNANGIAIKAQGISKCYRIGLKEKIHDSIGGAIFDFVKSPWKNYRKYRSLYTFDDVSATQGDGSDSPDIIWALKDVSFEIKDGEVVGFIGRNGAGKSTLLKILSRITDPTAGYAEIHGRVCSLLEVGTGFHPELTGRENVYLNGTILGMKKKEIDERFDEIVAFSEVDQFLDTPVKRYSSGMRVRLAFSVAAHLQPEILMIDEVLAVGDMAFQRKCFRKMETVASEGRTVLFVSHNMVIITELCEKCVLLSDGKVEAFGDSKDVVNYYVSSSGATGQVDLKDWSVDRGGQGPMRILAVQTQNASGEVPSHFGYNESVFFNIRIQGEPGNTCILGVSVRNALGHLVLHFSNKDDMTELVLPSAESEIRMCLENNLLNDGIYYVTIWLGDGFNFEHDVVRNCLNFTVESKTQANVICQSPIRLPAQWQLDAVHPAKNQSPPASASAL